MHVSLVGCQFRPKWRRLGSKVSRAEPLLAKFGQHWSDIGEVWPQTLDECGAERGTLRGNLGFDQQLLSSQLSGFQLCCPRRQHRRQGHAHEVRVGEDPRGRAGQPQERGLQATLGKDSGNSGSFTDVGPDLGELGLNPVQAKQALFASQQIRAEVALGADPLLDSRPCLADSKLTEVGSSLVDMGRIWPSPDQELVVSGPDLGRNLCPMV